MNNISEWRIRVPFYPINKPGMGSRRWGADDIYFPSRDNLFNCMFSFAGQAVNEFAMFFFSIAYANDPD